MSTRITLVRAPNPSAMTLTGTNSYLIDCGAGSAICIDPGPAIERHVDALVKTAERMNLRIALILLTHSHPDHAPASLPLSERTGAPVAAHAKSQFPHARDLHDAEVLRLGDTALQVVDAPGHTFDHLVFYEPRERALFTGDVVLGEGYVVIAPPNGAMRPYQRTLRRLLEIFPHVSTIYGGHGEPVAKARAKLEEYVAHRQSRQREVMAALQSHPQTIPELVRAIYRDTNPVLWPAAARQLLAYLIALEQEGLVQSHVAGREMSAEERAMLNPAWETIVGREHARTVEAELGAMLRLECLRVYSLSS